MQRRIQPEFREHGGTQIANNAAHLGNGGAHLSKRPLHVLPTGMSGGTVHGCLEREFGNAKALSQRIMQVIGNAPTLHLLRHDEFGRKRAQFAIHARQLFLPFQRFLRQQFRQLAVGVAQGTGELAPFRNVTDSKQHQRRIGVRSTEGALRAKTQGASGDIVLQLPLERTYLGYCR